jgi:RimJ/RimL family protein N-acetyltransferase
VLRGERIGLRARQEADLPVLMDELYDDVESRSRADSRPWVPKPANAKSGPYAVDDLPDTVACFSVVELQSKKLAGDAVLWAIDLHNRIGHLGVSIRPLYRGQGLASDVVRVLCHYGFDIRGLNRLQIETLVDNEPMRRAAVAAGFSLEGTLRGGAWVLGGFVDEVVYGLLAAEWRS